VFVDGLGVCVDWLFEVVDGFFCWRCTVDSCVC